MNAAPSVPATQASGKHVPERSCVACRRRRPQAELLRLRGGGRGAAQPEGWRLVQGHAEGRSVYLCADTPACWAEKRLRRALGAAASRLSRELLTRPGAGEAGTEGAGVTDAPAPTRYAEESEQASTPPRPEESHSMNPDPMK